MSYWKMKIRYICEWIGYPIFLVFGIAFVILGDNYAARIAFAKPNLPKIRDRLDR